jgi:hypothetical protein
MSVLRTYGFLFTLMALFTIACSHSGSTDSSSNLSSSLTFAAHPSNFKLALTDKPTDEAKSVNVNVKLVEVFVEKSGQERRVVIAQDVGMIDLLKLRNNVFKTLGVLPLPNGLTIHQIRMVLGDGNNLIKNDGSVCSLATPSAQQSGVKLLFTPSLTIEAGYSYSVALDFDVDSSIVFQGNGGCLLKPVIKVKTAQRTVIEPIPAPTPSPSPAPAPTPPPATDWTPVSGSVDTLPTSGTTSGDFTPNTAAQDPVTLTPSDLWTL